MLRTLQVRSRWVTIVAAAQLALITSSAQALPQGVEYVVGDLTSLKAAWNAAGTGDIITIEAETTIALDETLDFNGRGLTVRGQDPVSSILRGGLDGPKVGSENVRHFRIASGEGYDTVIRDLTLEFGYDADAGGGGSIRLTDAHPTFINVTWRENYAEGNGGALRINITSTSTSAATEHPLFLDCEFVANVADGFGGAVDIYEGASPTFEGCTFIGNESGRGGGACAARELCASNWNNCLFEFNRVNAFGQDGGGALLFSSSQSPLVSSSTLRDNWVALGNGGGVHNVFSASVRDSILWSNAPNDLSSSGFVTVQYSNLEQGVHVGAGNLSVDPEFTVTSAGRSFLSPTSPCLNVGSKLATGNLAARTAQAGANGDAGVLDLGYHYQLSANPTIYGIGKLGSNGLRPAIGFTGTPASGSNFSVTLNDVLPLAPSVLAYGFGSNSMPLYGGTLWIKVQDQFAPILADPSGQAELALTPVPPFMAGLKVNLQWGSLDAADDGGIALSDAMLVEF